LRALAPSASREGRFATFAAMSDVVILGGPPRYTLDGIRAVVAAACERSAAQLALLFGS
jgi:hypothetical protein